MCRHDPSGMNANQPDGRSGGSGKLGLAPPAQMSDPGLQRRPWMRQPSANIIVSIPDTSGMFSNLCPVQDLQSQVTYESGEMQACNGAGASPVTPRMPLTVITGQRQHLENGFGTPLTPSSVPAQQSMTPKSKQKMASIEAANERLQQVCCILSACDRSPAACSCTA